jgi:hypothetical protein
LQGFAAVAASIVRGGARMGMTAASVISIMKSASARKRLPSTPVVWQQLLYIGHLTIEVITMKLGL